MLTDARAQQITTRSEASAAHLSNAIESFLAKRLDTRMHCQAALEEDPQCSMAHALSGLMLGGVRKTSMNALARQSLSMAQQNIGQATAREQAYVKALENILNGSPENATLCYEAVLADHPTDLLALSLAQAELFWLGDMPRANRLSAGVAAHWSEEIAGYPAYLAIRSFDLEEVGLLEEAETLGRQSVELESDNAWGAHSVAHVMLMQHRADEGLQWLDGLSRFWTETNQLKFHLWWHQCLFHLEKGNHTEALSIHDQWLRNPEQPMMQALPDFYLDLQNGASLLWRLESAGVDVGDRWLEMAGAVLPAYLDMTSPFTSAHIAMILQAAGMQTEFDKLLDTMERFIRNRDDALARGFDNALATARACRSHRQGHHAEVLELLMPRQASLESMGGSHAQQELFFQMMFDSACQLGRHTDMQTLGRELERKGFQAMNERVAYVGLQKLDDNRMART